MQNKLQELTEKLYAEGLSKGKQEGEEFLAKAKAMQFPYRHQQMGMHFPQA